MGIFKRLFGSLFVVLLNVSIPLIGCFGAVLHIGWWILSGQTNMWPYFCQLLDNIETFTEEQGVKVFYE